MRNCLRFGGLRKVYESKKSTKAQRLNKGTMALRLNKGTELKSFRDSKFQRFKDSISQSFKVSRFQMVAPNSVSGLVVSVPFRTKLILSTLLFIFVLIFSSGIPETIMAQESSDNSELEEALSGFDDEGSGEDDTLSGFDEDDAAESDAEIMSGFDDESESGIDDEGWKRTLGSVSGSTGISLSYSYAKEAPADKTQVDWSGLTKLRPFLYILWDTKLGENWKTRIAGKAFYDFAYGMKERKNFYDEVLAELEQEAELREFYLEGSPFGSLDVKIGSQIVAWGVANSLRVVDVLNPADNREFGMTDLEDIRLPIAMTKLDYYVGNLKLEAVAVHQIKFNKNAPFGSDFNSSPLKFREIVPESSAENTEYGLAVIGTFSGWDASLHWAQYFDDTAHFKITKVTIVPGVGAVPTLEQRHSRLTMAGATLSIPSGNFLWKAEAAHLQGMEFALVTDKTFSRTDVLVGTEYSGWNDTSLTLEFGVQHLNEFDEILEVSPDSQLEDRIATTISFMQDYINQTLHLNMVGMMIGKSGMDGGINRMSVDYDVMDAFSVSGGMMVYQTGDNAYFQSLNDNDRLFFEARYSF